MFENIISYESKHPETEWSGKLTYCKICGDIIIHIKGEPADTCACRKAYIGDDGCSGSSACYVDTKKGSKYMATINDEGLPSAEMVAFGTMFKAKYLETEGRHTVRITVLKPKQQTQKPAAKEAVKETKTETKSETKPEIKSEAKSETKPEKTN